MPADVNLLVEGTPVPVYLGYTGEAVAQAAAADAAADRAENNADLTEAHTYVSANVLSHNAKREDLGI